MQPPPPFRLGDPAVCGSHPLITLLYYCRLGDCVCVCVCVSLYCVAVVCALCVFWVFCSVFSFSILILLVGSFVSHITCAVLVETLNTAQSINQCLHWVVVYVIMRCSRLIASRGGKPISSSRSRCSLARGTVYSLHAWSTSLESSYFCELVGWWLVTQLIVLLCCIFIHWHNTEKPMDCQLVMQK